MSYPSHQLMKLSLCPRKIIKLRADLVNYTRRGLVC